MRALKFIETKITSENGFILDFFALRDEKESIYDKPILFWGCTWSLDLYRSPESPKDTYIRSFRLFCF